jgi:hypothetical protein
MGAITDAIVAVERVRELPELPDHADRALMSAVRLLNRYRHLDGRNHLRAAPSGELGKLSSIEGGAA